MVKWIKGKVVWIIIGMVTVIVGFAFFFLGKKPKKDGVISLEVENS